MDVGELVSKLKRGETPPGADRFTSVSSGMSLTEMLTYQNPNMSSYRGLIEQNSKQSSLRSWDTEFSRAFASFPDMVRRHLEKDGRHNEEPEWQNMGEAVELFRQRLSEEVLIDLGGGSGRMLQYMATPSNVSVYVNVDIGLRRSYNEKFRNSQECKVIEVNADMLDFVAHLASDRFNFTLNGIDTHITASDDYVRALALELARATKPGGIIFGDSSVVFSRYLGERSAGIREVRLGYFQSPEYLRVVNTPAGVHIFEKASNP